jgi:hypothetical protein
VSAAQTWRDAMRRARSIDSDRIAARIDSAADNGLRATRYDHSGGRTSRIPCREYETCRDGGPEPHSHPIVSDPTGNAAIRGLAEASDDLRQLRLNEVAFVRHAGIVLDWVKGERPSTWAGVVALDAALMPGTIQSGIDVDDERVLPRAIDAVGRAVDAVERIADRHLPREPSQDEQHWTAGLADEDCCAWHIEVHRRYRRPRAGGTNCCAECLGLAELLGRKPPTWLIEAMIDHGDRPIAWRASLSRAMDELGVERAS